jgi:hypothetical protein
MMTHSIASAGPSKRHWSERLALPARVVGHRAVASVDICGVPRKHRRLLLDAGEVRINGIAVRVVGTAQRLGGRRAWWGCPACDGRARILYWLDGLRCRECAELTYACRALHRDSAEVFHRAARAVEAADRELRRRRSPRRRADAEQRAARAERLVVAALQDRRDRLDLDMHAIGIMVERSEASGEIWTTSRPALYKLARRRRRETQGAC